MQTSLVRLTAIEFDQAATCAEPFYHVNLQHYGIPYGILSCNVFLGVRILKHGNLKKEPILDMSKLTTLKLLDIKHSIPVTTYLKMYAAGKLVPVLTHNPQGPLESLVDKYSCVLGISRTEILAMYCYIRKFVNEAPSL